MSHRWNEWLIFEGESCTIFSRKRVNVQNGYTGTTGWSDSRWGGIFVWQPQTERTDFLQIAPQEVDDELSKILDDPNANITLLLPKNTANYGFIGAHCASELLSRFLFKNTCRPSRTQHKNSLINSTIMGSLCYCTCFDPNHTTVPRHRSAAFSGPWQYYVPWRNSVPW